MFTIDRQQGRIIFFDHIHEDPPGHYHRFLVCKQNLLAIPGRGESRADACSSDNCRHHRVDVRQGLPLFPETRLHTEPLWRYPLPEFRSVAIPLRVRPAIPRTAAETEGIAPAFLWRPYSR